ncbi:glycerol-3-phosphate dehydrogenase [Undibacterium sp. Ji22W]|uniref:glycerol-3-phosphate dehydrogenase n=1 Tax=Undibacterium sp. Ji22W TaxID=3413038 RepID=UPI003BF0967F
MQADSVQYQCDLLIVGGGINGVGIARDAAGRGLSVVLCEKDDLAAHTSSASSKLIHGGLRYLEYYEFSLVRKALLEREDLLRLAPHLISPLRFVMPLSPGLRPAWLLRLGLFVYDHLAPRQLLAGTENVQFSQHFSGKCLKSYLKKGFLYSDAWVDDARLVILNALDAAERGANILTHTRCDRLVQNDGRWLAHLSQKTPEGVRTIEVNAACVVNATGAWAAQVQQLSDPGMQAKKLRLIKGSHIVVKKLFEHSYAYIFQHPDGRIVFAIPYETEFTLIGTTDFEYKGNLDNLQISTQEIAYLCELSNQYFQQQIAATDVIHSYSGVRPLVDDGHVDAKSITRDYKLEYVQNGAPILHVFGGKITTYRRLAEDAMSQIAPYFNQALSTWTKSACLPGGDIVSKQPNNENLIQLPQFLARCQQQYHWLPAATVLRMVHAYGSRIHVVLADCFNEAGMGEQILPGLYACEVKYLLTVEFANSAQDILWRRSKLGLHLTKDAEKVLDDWIVSHRS